jgi:2,4-dienoyl-CoA reductase-like NADH-dependent reductase (Old Yellow Enzyme family)
LLKLGAGAAALPLLAAPQGGGRAEYHTFSEGRIASLRLKNRWVRSATAESASPNGEMSEAGIDMYRDLARGGVGLVITGHMAVMAAGRADSKQTCIYDDRFTPLIRKIADVVHQTGHACKVVAEIAHAGMQSRISEPVAPSAKSWPNRPNKPRALTTREVEELVTHFAQAARRVQAAGFDGVQIHAAHGYLLSSFLSSYTNTRTDRYGGSLAKRVTVVREIVERARALVGPEFPILIKMNCEDGVAGGIDIDNFPELAREIEKAGIQAVEVSGNNPIRGPLASADDESYFLKYLRRVELSIPLILTGGNRSVERLEAILKTGKPDFFGLARPLLREPDLPNRWLEGRGGPESTCISCNRCIAGLGKGEVTRCRIEEA